MQFPTSKLIRTLAAAAAIFVPLVTPSIRPPQPASSVLPISISSEVLWKGNKPVAGSLVVEQTNCATPYRTIESGTGPMAANGTAQFTASVDFSQPLICLVVLVNDPNGLNLYTATPGAIPNVQPFSIAGSWTLSKVNGKIVLVNNNGKSPNTLAAGSGFTPTFEYQPPAP